MVVISVPSNQPGFTLIELALVIALVTVLSEVAFFRSQPLVTQAEEAVAHDFLRTLNTASATYIMENRRQPAGFTDFITTNPAQLGRPNPSATGTYTLATPTPAGRAPAGTYCPTITATQINCTGFSAPQNQDVVYTLNNGVITVSGLN